MMEKQIKDMAWNTFKQTGDINTFLEFIQIENMENNKIQNQLNNIEEKSQNQLENIEGIQYGNYQN